MRTNQQLLVAIAIVGLGPLLTNTTILFFQTKYINQPLKPRKEGRKKRKACCKVSRSNFFFVVVVVLNKVFGVCVSSFKGEGFQSVQLFIIKFDIYLQHTRLLKVFLVLFERRYLQKRQRARIVRVKRGTASFQNCLPPSLFNQGKQKEREK